MNRVLLDEFPLFLSTGEEIPVSILVLELLQASPIVLKTFEHILSLCTQITHDELEEAKSGYDTALKKKLRSPPNACLIRLNSVCGEINQCSMAVLNKCTTKNTTKNGGAFPFCWTTPSVEKLVGFERSWSIELCNAVVHAWRQGRYVIVVI